MPASCHSVLDPQIRLVPGSPCSLPSLTKRHSLFPFQNFSEESSPPLHQIPFANSILFPSSASFHPIPILSFSTGRPPLVPLSSNLMRSLSSNFVPIAGAITPYLVHSSSLSALSPCHVSPTTPCTSRPATTRYHAADTASTFCSANLPPCDFSSSSSSSLHSPLLLTRPCLNLKYNVVPTSRCKVAAHTSRPRTQPHSCCWVPLLSSSHQTYDCIPCNHSRATRFLPIYRRSFHPLWHPASAQSLSQFAPPTSNRKFISAND